MKNCIKKFLVIIFSKLKLFGISNSINKQDITFVDQYKNLDDLKKNNSNISKYLNDTYDDKNTINYKEKIKFNSIDRNIILPLIISILSNKEIKILDVGGGNPPIYEFINGLTNKVIKSWIYERKEFVEKIKDVVPKNKENNVIYFHELDQIKQENIDIVYFGSSLQYLPNYKNLIKKMILSFEPEYIIIADTVFNYSYEDYYVLQVNMKPSIFPNQFISYDKFIKFMNEQNYQCVFNFNNPSFHVHKSIKKSDYNFKHIILKKNLGI